MAAFGRWSDLFGRFRQRTRSKLPSRGLNRQFEDSAPEVAPAYLLDFLRLAPSLQDSWFCAR